MAQMHNQLSPAEGIWALRRLPDMDEAQFSQWQTLLEHRTGITLTAERRSFLETNLGIRMREIGCSSYQAYYEKIVNGPDAVREWATLVDRLTVQETRFFRDPDAFRLVADYVLTRPREQFRKRALEAWSVGCSTGEEPYTLAMILNECMGQLALQPLFGVTGSDISLPAIEKARQGQFNARKLLGMDEDMKARYFRPSERNTVEIVNSIRDRVCFTRLNVLDLDKAPMHGMNIIFCQNLLIYFRRWRRREIVKRLAERLAPGGLLVLGQGELTDWQPPGLQRLPSEHVLAWIKRQSDEE
ncbi:MULTISPECIES: CheR family methyltransferase [Marinobacter]|jgi:chemotaxis protein methyltransferase CheR/type IV pilus assembly protein PilK|uniref:protein-glutamate O-methyltransferase n=5 Tax=Marinobacter TaxID=2742 RepID=A0A1M2UU83_MARNT|nr:MULTISPECIES: protein-glutamate O-methyltransferase CheR [Marinobacter]WBU41178.1 protein-glutamate O-methyltransferase CheR [Marinobacter alkaliphilus]MAO13259.1 methyltransferase [Marinobacter sp.]MCD1631239.1 protein-glutamate O-methyltransferase CheR [Marinobacter shengliensis]MDX5327889.1 protein-glutamate O-methyltransferase CheR [Marinobacter sp.]OJS98876.1 methyltransferase [Marinobacter nauticus]|tara:strand:- start:2239 stop:3138 length:900 start_codon:yes stop_codon:yes gene_type:complete